MEVDEIQEDYYFSKSTFITLLTFTNVTLQKYFTTFVFFLTQVNSLMLALAVAMIVQFWNALRSYSFLTVLILFFSFTICKE